jgi:hypothetical protein
MRDKTQNDLMSAFNNALQGLSIYTKWRTVRDSHYGLYEVTDDIDGYKESIRWYQHVIKGWMQKNNQKIAEAVIDICSKEDDASFKIKFICAGYDLAGGIDYTLD